jgi:hypothetical protein
MDRPELPDGGECLFRPGTRPPASALVEFIDSHKDRFGVEPACAVLEISPSAYYAGKKREESPSARDEHDNELKKAITRARERRFGSSNDACVRDGLRP